MTKSELKAIVQKATEEVWYNRRSLNPVEEQTELITEKLYEALILPVVVRQSEQLCDCEYPLIRTGENNLEYCGFCMKNIS